jgi:hypothetical protein
MLDPAVSSPSFRIVAQRMRGNRDDRRRVLWCCTGCAHLSWLVTVDGETAGPFVERCAAIEVLQ